MTLPRRVREAPCSCIYLIRGFGVPFLCTYLASVCFLMQGRDSVLLKLQEEAPPTPAQVYSRGTFFWSSCCFLQGSETLLPCAGCSGSCRMRTSRGSAGLVLHVFSPTEMCRGRNPHVLRKSHGSDMFLGLRPQWKANDIYLKSSDMTYWFYSLLS